MAPARPRAVDDSRSEASSTIASLKEKAALNAFTGAGISKSKKNAAAASNGVSKTQVNGAPADTTAAAANLPKTDWTTMSPLTLMTYRAAYQIPTAPCYLTPHADIIYNSSQTALRAPSAVLARKRMHEFRQQQRNAAKGSTAAGKKKARSTGNGAKNGSDEATAVSSSKPLNGLPTGAGNDQGGSTDSPAPSHASLTMRPPSHLPLPPPEQIERQTPAALAQACRKHFNAQQLNEMDTVAKFLYVVRDNASRAGVRTEGSAGDGTGWSMGSQGRAVRKGEGGEVGFRLRFRPR